jgi:carbon-monoxide dehydrogenase large subunit
MGVDPVQVQVRLGDTETSPYSSGALGSRGMVWAGGATSRACKELAQRVKVIGAAMLQTDVTSVTLRDGGVHGPQGSVSLRDVARAYYLTPSDLPIDTDHYGLEVTGGYTPELLTGIGVARSSAPAVAISCRSGPRPLQAALPSVRAPGPSSSAPRHPCG